MMNFCEYDGDIVLSPGGQCGFNQVFCFGSQGISRNQKGFEDFRINVVVQPVSHQNQNISIP